MRTTKAVVVVAGIAFGLGLASVARAECSPENWKDCEGKPWVIGKAETPIGERWWPNKLWGAGDEAGSTNWYTKPEVVLRALAEADKGKVYQLGRNYESGMPTFSNRVFELKMPSKGSGGPAGANAILYRDEIVTSEIGQVGTQFDGIGHISVSVNGVQDTNDVRYYNGFKASEVVTDRGLKKVGVEKMLPIVARGVLLDIAAAKDVEMLDKGYVITRADVNVALAQQGMAGFEFMPGDGVFFHTGWGKLWMTDNDKFNSGEPGIGMEVAKWLSDDVQAGVVGADTWGTEAVPGEDPGCVFCVHSHLLTRHGLVNQEIMYLDELIRDGVYTFTYVYSPMPILGATGSPGAPIAID
ncbi:MAG: cyclase family protein [Alphaproteobacteria bacterium]